MMDEKFEDTNDILLLLNCAQLRNPWTILKFINNLSLKEILKSPLASYAGGSSSMDKMELIKLVQTPTNHLLYLKYGKLI